MTGFIRGLFGSKQNGEADFEPPAPKQKQEAYFLDSDAAKTFGDIDYMRTSKQTRRTFPKQKVGFDNAFVHKVSADLRDSDQLPPTSSMPASPTTPSPASNAETTERRRMDSSMDMFRSMARDMGKR